jgi:hypothetical protein
VPSCHGCEIDPKRQEAEATITGDMLAVERSECALIWHADAKGDVIDFRSTTSPLAVLGLNLTTPAILPPRSVSFPPDRARCSAHPPHSEHIGAAA